LWGEGLRFYLARLYLVTLMDHIYSNLLLISMTWCETE